MKPSSAVPVQALSAAVDVWIELHCVVLHHLKFACSGSLGCCSCAACYVGRVLYHIVEGPLPNFLAWMKIKQNRACTSCIWYRYSSLYGWLLVQGSPLCISEHSVPVSAVCELPSLHYSTVNNTSLTDEMNVMWKMSKATLRIPLCIQIYSCYTITSGFAKLNAYHSQNVF
jgi:hypothetical protein